jgi:hypothetical protein
MRVMTKWALLLGLVRPQSLGSRAAPTSPQNFTLGLPTMGS